LKLCTIVHTCNSTVNFFKLGAINFYSIFMEFRKIDLQSLVNWILEVG
jgi:hypothetical protein